MANADYTIRAGAQGFCPVGYLSADITQLQTAVTMTGYTSPIADGIRLGMAAMIISEIPSAVPVDPYFGNVILSCNFDTDYTDASPVGRTLTAAGGTSISNTSPKFGAGALHVAVFGDTLTSPYSADLLMPGDFTIRCWVKTSTITGVVAYVGNSNGGDPAWRLGFAGAGIAHFQWYFNSGANTNAVFSTTVVTDGLWHHIEVTRSGNEFRIFVDGVREGSIITQVGVIGAATGTPTLSIGSYPNAGSPLIGRVDDLEITVGLARHTASFTLPTEANPQQEVDTTPPTFRQEIVEVVARSGNNLTLARGCCDTVPALHSAGAGIWFFDGSIASDRIEYAGTETIGVKVLPRISSGAEVPIENSPPAGLTFNLRFARPYPPGLVEVNGDPWFTDPIPFNLDVPTLVITWAHRDRITQQDQLVDHLEADVGPEPGTTYELRVYKADDTLLRTVVGLTGTTWSYEFADAALDFSAAGSDYPGYITLCSRRDGLASFQQYRIDFTFQSSTTPVVSDPDYANVILLVQGGADASLTINDLSTYASTATITNYGEFDNAQQKFGANTIRRDTISLAVAPFSSTGSTSRFGRAAGDILTVECWVYIGVVEIFAPSGFFFSLFETAGVGYIFQVGTYGGTAGSGATSTKLYYSQPDHTKQTVDISTGWHFIQYNLNADTTYTLDLDGVEAYSGTNNYGIGLGGIFKFLVGSYLESGSTTAPTTQVWVTPLRVTKGVARARGSVPTEPFIGDITGGPDVVEETFTLTTSLVTQPAGAAIAMNLTQLAAPTSAGSAYVGIFYCPTALQADPLPDGTTLSVSFGIGLSQSVAVLTVLSYTAVGATSKATAMAALIAQANAATALSSRGLTASANSYLGSPGMQIQGPDGFKLHSSFGIMDPGVQAPVFTQLSNLLVAEFTLGSPAVGSALNQLVTATLSGTPAAGDRFTVTLDGVAYSYTAASGDTVSAVATALAALIDAAPAYAASAVGAVITIDGVTATNVFTYSSSAEALFAF